MNRATLMFLGAFLVLTLSWGGLLLSNEQGYGALTPYFDDNESKAYPALVPGLAARGALVYADLGCAYCHTQQVRGGELSADLARHWGDRVSYGRDYIRNPRVLLGDLRVGQDLRNFGARAPAAATLYLHLYDPAAVVPGSTMPPHPFLFEQHAISGQPSPLALKVGGVAPGTELVPTERAEALVAYLLSLKDGYDFPEESRKNTPPPPPKEKAGGKKEIAAPAAAPKPEATKK